MLQAGRAIACYAAALKTTQGLFNMLRLVPAILLSFIASFAHAVEEEPPIESGMTGVYVFLVLFVICCIWFVWYLRKNQNRRPEEKEGDKF
jgi:hypothetical protein